MTKQYEFSGGKVRQNLNVVYVNRDADTKVFNYLAAGNTTLIISSRQTGKTSLAYAVANRLKTEENHEVCVIDMRNVATTTDPEVWHKQFFLEVGLHLEIDDQVVIDFITQMKDRSYCARITEFFRSIVRQKADQSRTITFIIDELDTVQASGFHTDEFFDAFRILHNERDDLKMSFAFMSINHPLNLIKLSGGSSFNIGIPLVLPDFDSNSNDHVEALAEGLDLEREQAKDVIRKVLYFTGGQPFLTILICQKFKDQQGTKPEHIEPIVQAYIDDIKNKRISDVHFANARDIILYKPTYAYKVLDLYRQSLEGPVSISGAGHREMAILRAAGLIRERNNTLEPRCRMYRDFFDEVWCKNVQGEIGSQTFHDAQNLYIPKAKKKKICVINTGGTIGMAMGPDGKMRAPEDLDWFFHAYREIFQIAEVHPIALECKDGANMVPEHWARIAEAVFTRRNDGFAGFVIAHGTDTLSYTASAVAFALGPNLRFPVVFTGAQSPYYVLHGDAKSNLLRACEVAAHDIVIPEVVVVFSDEVYRAVRVQKKDDYRFEGFHSPTYRPLAIIAERIEIQKEFLRQPQSGWQTELQKDFSDGVLQITQYPGFVPDKFKELLEDQDLKGIVIESLGLSNVPTEGKYSYETFIRQAIEKQIPVLITSRYPVLPEFAGKYTPSSMAMQWGAIHTLNMTPAAAMTKFMWVIPQVEKAIKSGDVRSGQKLNEIKRMMITNIIGEVDESK